jgi:hypothetical protein
MFKCSTWLPKVGSEKGFSNKPMTNLTRKILLTASSMRLMGMTPVFTKLVRMLVKS